jgi:hypothetical protein
MFSEQGIVVRSFESSSPHVVLDACQWCEENISNGLPLLTI